MTRRSLAKNTLFLIALSLFYNKAQGDFLDYNKDNFYDCSGGKSYTEEQEQDILVLPYIDRIAFLIIPPFSMFISLLVIVIFIKFNQTRSFPGYISFALAITDMVLNISYFSQAIYVFSEGNSPQSSDAFCQLTAAFGVTALTCQYIYNLAFAVIFQIKIRRSLKGYTNKQYYLHAFVLLISVVISMVSMSLKQNGLNLFGLCSFSSSNKNTSFFNIIVLVAFNGIQWHTVYYLKRVVPNMQLRENSIKIINHYSLYVVISSITFMVFLVSDFIESMNCGYIKEPDINIFITIGNLSRVFLPLFQGIVRLTDPEIRQYCLYILAKMKMISMDPEQFQQLEEQSRAQQMNQDSWVAELSRDLRISTVFTMLCSIYLDILEEDQKNSLGFKKLCMEDSQEIIQRVISNTVVNRRFKFDKWNFQKDNQRKQFQIVPIRMTTYSPILFRHIRDLDIDVIDFSKSLDVMKNQDQLLQAVGQADGGRSGEFFFFTYDNQLILKTLKEEELIPFKKNLYSYVEYMNQNQTSMISKIYGMYSFEAIKGDNQRINLLVMKNILSIPREYILRTYDLKGSKLGRQVLINGKDYEESILRKRVLKENEFMKYEKKIYLQEKESGLVKQILERDSQFLAKQQYVDYSLLIFKLDYKQYRLDQIQTSKQLFQSFNCMKDVRNNGIYYHIGIIDYLQEYNYKKKIEHKLKEVRYGQQADASIQEPNYYSQRFIEQIVKKIF
ncbi:hypothetical protein ABPG72_016945 [Tetrahymena utriculariae]